MGFRDHFLATAATGDGSVELLRTQAFCVIEAGLADWGGSAPAELRRSPASFLGSDPGKDTAAEIQRLCDYLGAGYCERRWAVERQTPPSRQFLRVLAHAQDPRARGALEEGIRLYEAGEYARSRKSLEESLRSRSWDYFAHQYLGFAAVREERAADAALRFDLAARCAEPGYYRALALSHLARSHQAGGDHAASAGLALQAAEADPRKVKFWVEAAVCHARLGKTRESLQMLKRAVSADQAFWPFVLAEPCFRPVRTDLLGLLEAQRLRVRETLRKAILALEHAVEAAPLAGVPLERFERAIARHWEASRQNDLFVLQDAVRDALQWRREASKAAAAAAGQTTPQITRLWDAVLDLDQREQRIRADFHAHPWGCLRYATWWVALGSPLFAIGFALAVAVEERSRMLSIWLGLGGTVLAIVFPLALLPLADRLRYYMRVTKPIRRIESQIEKAEREIRKLRERLEERQIR